ncbi:hypothetical protein C0992_000242 [Termitomyces sp. T32_za158]|nr:hypothetical protein C0992_000242 [Termitomyces sp. T32_za158]
MLTLFTNVAGNLPMFPNATGLGIAVFSNDADGVGVLESVKFRIIDNLLRLEEIDWYSRFVNETETYYAKKRRMAIPRPQDLRPPPRPISSLQDYSFSHPAYRLLQPCYMAPELLNPQNVSSTGVDDFAQRKAINDRARSCAAFLQHPTTQLLLSKTPFTSVPTIVIPFRRTFATHLRLTHWSGPWFNLTVAWGNHGEHESKDDKNRILIGLDEQFEVEWVTDAEKEVNLRFDFHPAAITFPKNAQEISEIVQIGASEKLNVAARSGGHSYIANGLGGSDGILVVDLRNLDRITVDAATDTAIIESGNRLGNIIIGLANAGRALPHGVCPYVGIGGHASFGGFGFTSRMWGLTLDTIKAVNTVLANGTLIRATVDNYPDLFWGLRGSASSFGITTSIEVATQPAPPSATIFRYTWDLKVDAAVQGLAAFQSFVETDIPAHFGGEINLSRGSSAGTITFELLGGWYAPVEGLNSTLAPLLSQMPAEPRALIQTGSYLNSAILLAGQSLDTMSTPDSHDTFYAKSLMTPESSPISKNALLAFVRYIANEGFTSQMEWFVQFELYGGQNSAINSVSPDATAFAHRSSTFTIQFYASAPGNVPPFPSDGFTFLDDMVQTLTRNSPTNWDYGQVVSSPFLESS